MKMNRKLSVCAGLLVSGIGLNSVSAGEPDLHANPPLFAPNDVSLYYNTDAYIPMREVVASAKKSLRIDFYLFSGEVAEEMIKNSLDKARQGVDVRVILDRGMGGRAQLQVPGMKVIQMMKDALAADSSLGEHFKWSLAAYDNMDGTPFTEKKHGIDHQKYVIADAETDQGIAEVGSTNLAEEFKKYHDLAFRVKGQTVKDLAAQFDIDWYNAIHEGHAIRPTDVTLTSDIKDPETVPAQNQRPMARIVGSGFGRHTSLTALHNLLAGAKESIHIQMHEMGLDPGIMRILREKARLGLDVRVILDPNDTAAAHIDPTVPFVDQLKARLTPKIVLNACFIKDVLSQNKRDVKYMKKHHFERYNDRKIGVQLFPVQMMPGGPDGKHFVLSHMKSVVVDGNRMMAGSINWTDPGFTWVAETDLEVWGGQPPVDAEANFARDWELSSKTPAVEPGYDPLLVTFYQSLLGLVDRVRGVPSELPPAKRASLEGALALCEVYRKDDHKLKSFGPKIFGRFRKNELDLPEEWAKIPARPVR